MTIPRWQCAVLAFVVTLAAPYATWLSMAEAQQRQTSTMDLGVHPGVSAGGVAGAYCRRRGGSGLDERRLRAGQGHHLHLGTAATIGLLLVTFGTAYTAAKKVFREGCGGDWVLTPEHLSGATPKPTYDYIE